MSRTTPDGANQPLIVRGTEILASDTRHRGVRLVAVTAYGQESDRRRTRQAGFHHHLVKPVNIDAIEATLLAFAQQDTE